MNGGTGTQEDGITDDITTITNNNKRLYDATIRSGYSLTSGEGGTLSSQQSMLTSCETMATRNEHSWTYVKNELRKIKTDDKKLNIASIQSCLNKAPSNTTSMMNTANSSVNEQQTVTSLAQMLERDIVQVLKDMKDVASRQNNLAKLEDRVLNNREEQLRQQKLRQIDFDKAQMEVAEMLTEIRALQNKIQLSEAVEVGVQKQVRQKHRQNASETSNKPHAVISANQSFMIRSNQIELELPTFMAAASSFDLLVADPRVNEKELEECMRKGEDLLYGSLEEEKTVPTPEAKINTNRTTRLNPQQKPKPWHY